MHIPKKTLILGAPGSGKSYISQHAKKQGLPAYDADYDIEDLAEWTDDTGTAVAFPEKPTVDWLEAHHFLWNPTVLTQFLQSVEHLYLFGIAENAFELSTVFDESYYLLIDEETLRPRIYNPSRKNVRGKSEEEIQQILRDIQADHLPMCAKYDIQVIDADMSPDRILKRIVV